MGYDDEKTGVGEMVGYRDAHTQANTIVSEYRAFLAVGSRDPSSPGQDEEYIALQHVQPSQRET